MDTYIYTKLFRVKTLRYVNSSCTKVHPKFSAFNINHTFSNLN